MLTKTIYKIVVLLLLSISLLQATNSDTGIRWQETSAYILEVKPPYKDSVLQMIVYGYYVGALGIVDSTRIAYDSSTEAYNCLKIKYSKKDYWKNKIIDKPYTCDAEGFLMIYGTFVNRPQDKIVFIEEVYPDGNYKTAFASDDYFLMLKMSEKVILNYEVDGMRSKRMEVDMGKDSLPYYNILDLTPHFKEGIGIDSAYMHYSAEADEWYYKQRE